LPLVDRALMSSRSVVSAKVRVNVSVPVLDGVEHG
jgi:hypothetical protein